MESRLARWILAATPALLLLGGGPPPCASAGEGEAPDPIRIAAPDGGARQPSVAVDDQGAVHVVFVSGSEVRITSCPPGAEKFGEPRLIAGMPDLACGMRRGPRLVACDRVLVVSWIGPCISPAAGGKETDRDLTASVSSNGGATWSRPSRINKTPGACGEGLHALASGPGKTVYAAWLQPVRPGKKGTGIRLARSDDAGATWPFETSVYDPPSGTVCECCHPTVAVAPDGAVSVMFRNSLDGARDMYVVTSRDRGKKFGPARKLGEGSWKLPACPMDGGGAACSSDGDLLSAWRRDRNIYLVRGAGVPENAGEGEQPWVGGVPGGETWAAWSGAGGMLRARTLARSREAAFQLPGSRCLYPVVAGSSSGTIFAAWEVVREDGNPVSVYGVFLARPAPPK